MRLLKVVVKGLLLLLFSRHTAERKNNRAKTKQFEAVFGRYSYLVLRCMEDNSSALLSLLVYRPLIIS
jgi:hypothetical protein